MDRHSTPRELCKDRTLTYDLPVVVEIIDTDAKIEAFLPTLERLRNGALIIRHRVEVLGPSDPASAASA